ncbi:putative nicotinamide N-methyase [Rhizobium sp. BK376]|nr:putative nicotinamide N-methyase [Rhizobium sp. BK376]
MKTDAGGCDKSEPRVDAASFIAANMVIAPAPSVPEINLYTAHPGSGLWRLVGRGEAGEEPPYWAYRWAGGMVLARYILDHPETVSGKRVLDLGAGSGIVGIAAMKAGATSVVAADIDENAVIAIGLNAALNHVPVEAMLGDLTIGPPPAVDLIAVGDLFYEPSLALRVTAFLRQCLAARIQILVGDPGRAFLPHAHLLPVAEYPVSDFGEGDAIERKPSVVFSFIEAEE